MPWSPRHVPSQCPCEVRLHRLVFLVRTTYIDLRHAGAHMMIWYARWALVWYNLGRSSPFFRRDRNDHDVLPLHIALDNEAPT